MIVISSNINKHLLLVLINPLATPCHYLCIIGCECSHWKKGRSYDIEYCNLLTLWQGGTRFVLSEQG